MATKKQRFTFVPGQKSRAAMKAIKRAYGLPSMSAAVVYALDATRARMRKVARGAQ